jgi:hypothetical protein
MRGGDKEGGWRRGRGEGRRADDAGRARAEVLVSRTGRKQDDGERKARNGSRAIGASGGGSRADDGAEGGEEVKVGRTMGKRRWYSGGRVIGEECGR